MPRWFFCFCASFWLFLSASIGAQDTTGSPTPAPGPASKPEVKAGEVRVMVIPMKDAIDQPIFYILRRGLKQAIDQKFDAVLLDMDTPGGSLGTTFEILEALEKFPGTTLTYVNKDAISAGAFIAAMTQEIYFAPNGVIGAAAPVSGSGADIDKTMKQKVVSYLKARVRALSEGKGVYRGEVISSMLDEDFEFKIGERVIKKKGELLSLTAKEATEQFGEPAQPLLATGIAANVEEVLAQRYGQNNYTLTRLEVTWSEELASYLNTIKPILMGLAVLAIFIEFKMPGTGIFGAIGIGLFAVVFLSSFVAGLSGHEPMIAFVLGAVLVAVELFFFPGMIITGLLGGLLMLGSLVWAMADLWPQEPVKVAWDSNVFVAPLYNLALALGVAAIGAVLLVRFLPKAWLWDRVVLQTAIAGNAQMDTGTVADRDALVGAEARALTDLFPTGTVEVAGRRYEARMRVGSATTGERLRVKSRSGFGLIVDRDSA